MIVKSHSVRNEEFQRSNIVVEGQRQGLKQLERSIIQIETMIFKTACSMKCA